MKSKIYTFSGDKGTTALVGGKRVEKDNVRVEAYGTIDELNANIGMMTHNSSIDENPEMPAFIFKMQNKLFNIGAYLATDSDEALPVKGLSIDDIK